MPLVVGLAAKPTRATPIEKLAAGIRERDNHTSAGDIGYRYVIRAPVQRSRGARRIGRPPTGPSSHKLDWSQYA